MRPTSYVIVERATGRGVLEIWGASLAAKVNTTRYAVMPILEYLYSLNHTGN